MDIIKALADPNLFAPWIKSPDTWRAWTVFLRTLFALSIPSGDIETFQQCTGRSVRPTQPVTEAWLVVGRRGGKSFILALIAVFIATFQDWRPHLAPGERGTVMILAADRRQARVIMRYIKALLEGVAMLSPLIEGETQESIDLNNRVTIEVHTASFRTVRGYTVIAALLDELAFWRTDDSANPDTEILAAIRPAMATVPGSILLCASSPYARRGALWEAFHQHYGKDGDPVLVWRADTQTMNPTVPLQVIQDARERDPSSAAAEYGAEFRADIERLVSREIAEACLVQGRHVLPPVANVDYVAFVDPSGGSADSFTLGIAHRDGDMAVVDCVVERRPPFSPDAVTHEFADLMKSYRCRVVVGDRYAGEWPRERFSVYGIEYRVADMAKSDIYRDLLPVLNSGRVELLDNDRLIAQLVGLERRTSRGGRDRIDHPPGLHDDLINAAAGAILLTLEDEGFVAVQIEVFRKESIRSHFDNTSWG